MEKFIEIYKLPQVTQDKIEILSRPVTNKEIASVIKNPSTKESPKPDGFNGEFYQTFKEELTWIILQLFKGSKDSEGIWDACCCC